MTMANNQSNPFEMWMDSMKNVTSGRDSLLSSYRKNMEALTETNKMVMETMRSATQLQQQYIKQAFSDLSSMMKEAMTAGNQHELWQKNSQHMKHQIDHTLDHGVQVANLLSQSHKEMCQAMKSHFEEQVADVKKHAGAEKSSEKAKH